MPKSRPPVNRRYDSPLRRDQARTTQRAIVDAASRLFGERGYVATSIDAIAAAAGVSRATVFTSVGGKRELLRRAYEIAVRGDEDPTPLGQRARARAVLADPNPHRLLRSYAAACAEIAPRMAPVYDTLRAAAQADAEIAQLWETIAGERRFGTGRVANAVADLGALRPGLGRETAGDILWVLTDPSHYTMLVDQRKWSPTRFKRWLAKAMQTELLAEAPSTGKDHPPKGRNR
jgi:AcrR family transcriptional regulator